jgi:hypothetical protein
LLWRCNTQNTSLLSSHDSVSVAMETQSEKHKVWTNCV